MTQSNEKITALYERLSHDEMQSDSNSISNQNELLETYAKNNNFKNIVHFYDDGFTGANFNRPGWKSLIAEVENKNVGTLIIKDMSRFGRDHIRVGLFMEMFLKYDVRFIAVTENIDSADGYDDFLPFRNVMNEHTVRETSRKIRAVFKSQALQGKHVSPSTPYGYLRNPNDKQKWIVDEEAAEVIKRIFQMVIEGNGVYQIANILTNEKILIPSAHWKEIGADNLRHNDYEDPYRWRGGVVARIIERKEYMGHTEVFKTHTISYKNKRSKATPLEERIIFENTHEGIIDTETWNNAQRLRRTVRKPNKFNGEPNRLTGILYCADCGSKMSNDRSKDNRYGRKQKNEYVCSRYRTQTRKCTAHYIRVPVVEELILKALKEVSLYAKTNKKEFANMIMKSSSIQHDKNRNVQKKKLSSLRKRNNELDNIIRKLYEDNISGKLSDKRFEKLSADYEQEQDELEKSIQDLETEVNNYEQKSVDVENFLILANKYTNFEELTTPMLNEFIEKIVIHERVKEYRYKKHQRVDIYFNFVGMIELQKDNKLPIEIEPQKKVSKVSLKVYATLKKYLEQQESNLLELKIADFENIIGEKMKPTAYKSRSYWYPHKHRPLGGIIYNAGYDIEKIDLENQTIILSRPKMWKELMQA